MAIKRIVDIGFWPDSKVINQFTPEDKYFMLYLLTNPHTTQLGIYEITPKQIAFEMGYSLDTILVLLERFENKYKIIRYSSRTNEIAVKNYLQHSIIKGGTPVYDLLIKERNVVKDKSLLEYIKDILSTVTNATVIQFLNTIDIYINDNDDSYHESYAESYHDSSKLPKHQAAPTFSVPSLDDVKGYCAERNNGIDAQTFIDFYEAKGWCIGKERMKSWKAAIRTWENRNKQAGGRPSKEVGAHRYGQREYQSTDLNALATDIMQEARKYKE